MNFKKTSTIGLIAFFSLSFSHFILAKGATFEPTMSETIELPCLFVTYGEDNKLAAITLKMKQIPGSSSWDISQYQILGEVDSKNRIIGKDGEVIEGQCSEHIRPEVASTF